MKAALERIPSLRTLVRWTAGPVLGLVFLAAAYSKAVDPRETIRVFEWLAPETPVFADLALRALVLGELALGALLLTGLGGRATFGAAIAVLVVFTAWIGYLMAAGLEIGCGCGLSSTWLVEESARAGLLGRNISLLAIASIGFGMFGPREAPGVSLRRADDGSSEQCSHGSEAKAL